MTRGVVSGTPVSGLTLARSGAQVNRVSRPNGAQDKVTAGMASDQDIGETLRSGREKAGGDGDFFLGLAGFLLS